MLIRLHPYDEPNLRIARAWAFAASISRFLGGEAVTSEFNNLLEAAVTSSTARWNAAWLACEGLPDPLIFRTNCSAAFWISSSVAGGSKLKSVLMFLHILYVAL